MAVRMTTEEFTVKAIEVHGGRYDYSKTEYVRSAKPVVIICPDHGEFNQIPNNHLRGAGCKACGYLAVGMSLKSDTNLFVSKAQAIHGTKYDYSHMNYTNYHTTVRIGCEMHGQFLQSPGNHLNGKGCPDCKRQRISASRTDSVEDFLVKAVAVHGEKYDYSQIDYARSRIAIDIACPEHGSFLQFPANHLHGQGCPLCCSTGYKTSKRGYFYILTCGDITKIGITNLNPKVRAKSVSRSFGSEFSIMRSYACDDGNIPLQIEVSLLKRLRPLYEQPTNVFDGYSECFLDVDRDNLIQMVEDML